MDPGLNDVILISVVYSIIVGNVRYAVYGYMVSTWVYHQEVPRLWIAVKDDYKNSRCLPITSHQILIIWIFYRHNISEDPKQRVHGNIIFTLIICRPIRITLLTTGPPLSPWQESTVEASSALVAQNIRFVNLAVSSSRWIFLMLLAHLKVIYITS